MSADCLTLAAIPQVYAVVADGCVVGRPSFERSDCERELPAARTQHPHAHAVTIQALRIVTPEIAAVVDDFNWLAERIDAVDIAVSDALFGTHDFVFVQDVIGICRAEGW